MEEQNKLDNIFNLSFDLSARDQLKKIALWARICALCAFAGYAISLIVVLFGRKNFDLEAEGFTVGGYLRKGSSLSGVLVSIIIGGTINYFLYRFATSAKQGVESMDLLKLNEGLGSLRTYFKIFGILLVICLSFVGLAVIVGVLALGMGRR